MSTAATPWNRVSRRPLADVLDELRTAQTLDLRRTWSRHRRDVGEPAAPGKLADRRDVRRTRLGRSHVTQCAFAGVDHYRGGRQGVLHRLRPRRGRCPDPDDGAGIHRTDRDRRIRVHRATCASLSGDRRRQWSRSGRRPVAGLGRRHPNRRPDGQFQRRLRADWAVHRRARHVVEPDPADRPRPGRGVAFTGRTVRAPEALRIGLADRLIDTGTALDAAIELAETIAENSECSVRSTKNALVRNLENNSLQSALEMDNRGQALQRVRSALTTAREHDSGLRPTDDLRHRPVAGERTRDSLFWQLTMPEHELGMQVYLYLTGTGKGRIQRLRVGARRATARTAPAQRAGTRPRRPRRLRIRRTDP